MKNGTTLELLVEDLGPHGEGVSRIDGHLVFIPFALPKEKILASVVAAKKEYTSSRLVTIKEQHPHRQTPPCPRFHSCGGCQLMHLSYEGQLFTKTEKVKKALSEFVKYPTEMIHDCLPSPQSLHYRNKIQLPVASGENGELVMGFYRPSSHDIIPYEQCLIHAKPMEEYAHTLRHLIETSQIAPYNERSGEGILRHLIIRANEKGEALIGLVVTNGDDERLKKLALAMVDKLPLIKGIVLSINESLQNKILGDKHHVLWGEDHLVEEVNGLSFSISLSSFFQVNREASEVLYDVVFKFINPNKTIRLLDAYCGIGTMSLLFARHCKNVTGVECVPEAIENAKANAINNQITNTSFILGNIEEVENIFTDIDVAIINPPRKGLLAKVAKTINDVGPKLLVYVSCNPQSLARDLGILTNYVLVEAQPVDMFPQTMHVETVVKLSRKETMN